MASHGMTIEALPAPRITKDESTGLVEAASDGFRVLLQSPSGDAKFEMVFGRALARAGAVRAVDDTPLDLSAGTGQPVSPDTAAGAGPPATPSTPSLPAPRAAIPPPAAARSAGRGAGAFTAFDPVAGSVAPAGPGSAADSGAGAPAALAPPSRAAPARLTAQPVTMVHDLSSRVLTIYALFFAVVLAGGGFALGRRSRRFGGSA
jgi:hypothetical protein